MYRPKTSPGSFTPLGSSPNFTMILYYPAKPGMNIILWGENMTIHNISPDSVAMFIGSGELEQEGLDVLSLDIESAAKFAREAFLKAGIAVSPGMEIDAFAGDCGILVFAQLVRNLPVFYRFFDFENLLSAASAAESGITGRLYLLDGAWWLCVTGGWEHSAIFSEFGERVPRDAAFSAVLRERGTCVFEEQAIDCFREKFS